MELWPLTGLVSASPLLSARCRGCGAVGKGECIWRGRRPHTQLGELLGRGVGTGTLWFTPCTGLADFRFSGSVCEQLSVLLREVGEGSRCILMGGNCSPWCPLTDADLTIRKQQGLSNRRVHPKDRGARDTLPALTMFQWIQGLGWVWWILM